MSQQQLNDKYANKIKYAIMLPKKSVPHHPDAGTRLLELIDAPTDEFIAKSRKDIVDVLTLLLGDVLDVLKINIRTEGSTCYIYLKTYLKLYKVENDFTFEITEAEMIQYLEDLKDVISTLLTIASEGDLLVKRGSTWTACKEVNVSSTEMLVNVRTKQEVCELYQNLTVAPTATASYCTIYAKDNKIYSIDGAGTTTELTNASDKIAIIKHTTATGVNGGSTTAGIFNPRPLNTIETNDIGLTLVSNQFTLPAGRYFIDITSKVFSARLNKVRLTNFTDTTYNFGDSNDCGNTISSNATLKTVVNITSAKTYSIGHYVGQPAGSFGLGSSTNDGSDETYATVKITKLN